MGICLFTI